LTATADVLGDLPDAFHLLPARHFPHQLVIECVPARLILRRPDDGLGGVYEVATGKVGRRIGLNPGNVIQQLHAELLHGETHRVNHVAGAADPDGAVGLEHTLAGGEPSAVELMVEVEPPGLIPRALVHGNHFARVAGDAVIGKKIGRVGENQVDAIWGNGGENLQAIALINLDVMIGVAKNRLGQLACELRGVGDCVCHRLWRR